MGMYTAVGIVRSFPPSVLFSTKSANRDLDCYLKSILLEMCTMCGR